MNRETARAEIRGRLTEYVEQITEKSKGKNMYVCPLCQSGTGKNRTGAFSIDPKDPEKWHCFACGKGGDIFDLISQKENLTEYNSQLTRLSELFDITVDREGGSYKKAEPKPIKEPPKQTAQPRDYTSFFIGAAANIEATDYWAKRGLSLDTVERFGLGYVSDWKHPNIPSMQPCEAFIIPFNQGSYTARMLSPNAEAKYYNVGPVDLLDATGGNYCGRLYIVEGAIDAMSIAEAGGRAIALNSATNWRKFVEQIGSNGRYIEILHQLPVIIIALDNDSKGQKATAELIDALSNIKVNGRSLPYVCYNPSGNYKDPNEALVKDREGFINAVEYGMNASLEELKAANERAAYVQTSAYYHVQTLLSEVEENRRKRPISTGFKRLDDAFEGGLREGLYFLGAISSLGKTTFVMQIADQIAKSGTDVLIFSLEMKRTELMSKSISRLTMQHILENGGDTRNAKTSVGIIGGWRYEKYSQEELVLISDAIGDYSTFAEHIYIHEGVGNIGAAEVRKIVEQHITVTGHIPVVVIDYMQILAPIDTKATDKQNTDWTVVALKRMSRDNKVPVIGISSFNRDNYNNPVNMASFKESGAIEYSSDILIGLQYEGVGAKDFNADKAIKQTPQKIELKILKNRNGSKGQVIPYKFYPMFNLFMEEE